MEHCGEKRVHESVIKLKFDVLVIKNHEEGGMPRETDEEESMSRN